MSRRNAQELLDGLIARAMEVNENPECAFIVERIDVFGSLADPNRPFELK